LHATKALVQEFHSEALESLLSLCQQLTYNAIHYAEENGIDDRRWMKGFYRTMKKVDTPSCYK
jgi:hypothetical protein